MAIPEPGCCDGPNDLLRKILIGLNDITPGGGAGSIAVRDEGVQLTAGVTSFDFRGAGVTATAVGNAVTVTVPGGGGGSGDVVGPASAINNDIAVFDGVTGKLIKDSGVLISSIVTNSTLQSGSQVIGSGVDTVSVVFGAAFAGVPSVVVSISRPVAENLITVNIDEASITAAGFTASLGAATGSANYRLKWMAK